MKIFNLTKNNSTYTSNSYYIRGDWNTLSDINTIIDTGRDPVFFKEIENIYTGVGKTRVERVLLTHNHYDHTGNLKEIIKQWNPEVFAMSKSMSNVTHSLRDGEKIRIGDREALVIACPGHSSDSVCYYVPEEKVLFSGDTQLTDFSESSYENEFVNCLEKIAGLDIEKIYPGHGDPIIYDCNKKLRESANKVKKQNNIAINLKRDQSVKSQYYWFNIEASNERFGKIRIAIKNKYDQIIADRVRPEAITFWQKMAFINNLKGSFVWKRNFIF